MNEILKDEFNIFERKAVRLLLHAFFLIPIKKNRILFESYKGKSYSCNPKYISEYLYSHYKEKFELIWVFNDPKSYSNLEGIKTCKYLSLKFFLYRFSSKFIICNMTDEVFLPKRKKQIIVNTWHAGGAYKKVGLSFNSNTKSRKWQDDIVKKETSAYVSSSEMFTRYNIIEAYNYHGEILNIGLPRNDLFFDQRKIDECLIKVRQSFKLENEIIVLYAPTFRGDYGHTKALSIMLPFEDVISMLKKRFGEDVVILNRSHYADNNNYHINSKNVIDANEYEDMQELLAATDILITDYSSSIWDFSLLKRPCILYVPDINDYVNNRGMYTPIETWPGLIARSAKELAYVINNFDLSTCKEKAENHQKAFGSFESGRACENMANFIIRKCELNEK